MTVKNLLIALCFVVIALPITAISQGRYVQVYSKGDVSNTIRRLEDSSNQFKVDFDRFLDQSNLNGTKDEDRINRIVRDYENSLDRLRGNFDSQREWWNARGDVRNVMSNARNVNQMMVNLPFGRRLERRWRTMRSDLNRLAETYDLPPLSNEYGDSGIIVRPGVPVGPSRVPEWAIGTFRGMTDSGETQLTISPEGTATVTSLRSNQTFTGRYENGYLNFEWGSYTLSRERSGIRTIAINDSRTQTSYRRM
jgi:hypothetical protein